MVIEADSSMIGRNRTLWYLLSIFLIIYVFSAKGYVAVPDTGYSIETAEAIVARGQLDIPYGEGGTLTAPDGRSYSKYGIGLPLYFIPFVVAGDALSKITRLPTEEMIGFLISFANVPFALLALFSFAGLLRLFGVAAAYAGLLLVGLGLGTLTWPYAVLEFSEAMQMGLLMLAVYGVARRSRTAIIAAGMAFAWLVLVKLIYIVFFPAFAIYLLTRPEELRHRLKILAAFTFPFIVACGFLAWLNVVRFGSAFESGYGGEARQFIFSQMGETVPKFLGSFETGIFVYCPILILGVFGWTRFFKRRRAEAALCLAFIVANFIWATSWWAWGEGWTWWGPRLLVPVIPLWFLPAAFLFQRTQSKWRLSILALITVFSVVSQVPAVLVKDMEIERIKFGMLTPAEQASAPSDYVMAYILLKHKLELRNEIYNVSEFGIPGNRELDLTGYRTFRGLNLWTELCGRELNKPALRWLPLIGLFTVIGLAIPVGKAGIAGFAQNSLRPAAERNAP
jgi:hypothetical protein